MAVNLYPSTIPGGLTPACSECGAAEDYDISQEEYEQRRAYWDTWTCPDCRKRKALLAYKPAPSGRR